jgi:hypothetical protein
MICPEQQPPFSSTGDRPIPHHRGHQLQRQSKPQMQRQLPLSRQFQLRFQLRIPFQRSRNAGSNANSNPSSNVDSNANSKFGFPSNSHSGVVFDCTASAGSVAGHLELRDRGSCDCHSAAVGLGPECSTASPLPSPKAAPTKIPPTPTPIQSAEDDLRFG